MTNKTTMNKKDRISLIKRTAYLKKSVTNNDPKKIINFINEVEHLLEIRLKKIDNELNKKNNKK